MTVGQKLMLDLGFIDETDKQDDIIVRRFIKYDDEDNVTDVINFACTIGTDINVYANSLLHRTGSRMNKDLLKAIAFNIIELEGK